MVLNLAGFALVAAEATWDLALDTEAFILAALSRAAFNIVDFCFLFSALLGPLA